MSAANRRRGHDAERAVARWLRDNGFPDAITTRAKLGHDGATAPGDIDFHPLVCLEVKDVAASAWPTWCRQAMAEAPPGTAPIVVRRTRGVPNPGLWAARVHGRTWLQVIRGEDPSDAISDDDWWPTNLATAVADITRTDMDGAA